MHSAQNYWVMSLLGNDYFLSPYVMFSGVGLILGLILLDKKLKKSFRGRSPDRIYVLYVFSIVIGWIGAHFADSLIKGESLTEAGFTFYGGLILGLLFFWALFCFFEKGTDLITALNAGIMPLVLGHAIGRIGCFFAGCCYGKTIQQGEFPSAFFSRHPTQLYESLFLLILFLFLNIKNRLRLRFEDLTIYLIAYGFFRFFIEFLRGDYRGAFLYGLSPSQLFSILIVAGTLLFTAYKVRHAVKG